MRREKKKTPQDRPNDPVEYEIADVSAMQALKRGEATADQQKRAIDWIIFRAARTDVLPYFDGADGARASAFATGRQFVGHQIVKLLRLDIAELRRRQEQKP